MVATTVLTRPLQHHNRRRFLHDTEQPCVPTGVETDGAAFGLGKVAAFVARPDPLSDGDQGARQASEAVAGLLHKVEGESLCRLPADAGQASQLGDQFLDGAHDR